MTIEASQLRTGQDISLDGHPYLISECFHVKPAPRGPRGFVSVKLTSLINGPQKSHRFSYGEMVKEAGLVGYAANYAGREGDDFVFQASEADDKFLLPSTIIGDSAAVLVEGMGVEVFCIASKPIFIKI